jgi:hypothetical protein
LDIAVVVVTVLIAIDSVFTDTVVATVDDAVNTVINTVIRGYINNLICTENNTAMCTGTRLCIGVTNCNFRKDNSFGRM